MKNSNKPKIDQFSIETGMGQVFNFDRSKLKEFLTESEIENFNSIGYSGKDLSGKKNTYEKYLNSLNKGTFVVLQTKHDGGDFSATYLITRIPNNKKASKPKRKNQLEPADIVLIAGPNKVQATVIKVIKDVVMVLPWDSGREDILLRNQLTFLRKSPNKPIEYKHNY